MWNFSQNGVGRRRHCLKRQRYSNLSPMGPVANKGDELVISTNLADAAQEILQHSFAVYKVPASTATNIRLAWATARNMFSTLTSAQSSSGSADSGSQQSENATTISDHAFSKYKRIHQGHLYGFHEPSDAKFLYRAYTNSPLQPWPKQPNNNDATKFQLASIQLAIDFHQILMDCLSEIDRQFWPRHTEQHSPLAAVAALNREVDGPHAMTQTQEPATLRYAEGGNRIAGGLSERQRRKRPRRAEQAVPNPTIKTLPASALDPVAQCPLDYFLYHNRSKGAHGHNCTEHVDRGVLIVVSLTNVPGLEVLSRKTGQFHCPEIISHNTNLYQEAEICAGGLVCIMAGDQLASLVSTSPHNIAPTNSASATGAHNVPACVHRVRDNMKQPRLSISYELRV